MLSVVVDMRLKVWRFIEAELSFAGGWEKSRRVDLA